MISKKDIQIIGQNKRDLINSEYRLTVCYRFQLPHHNVKNYKKSVVLSDLKKYHSWYNSAWSDIRDQHHAINNASIEEADPVNGLEIILSKTGLTKTQLQQLLGLVNEIDDIKDLRLSNKRIKRDTIGKD